MNVKSSYRLAVIDLDETLLGHDKQISAANLKALARLRAVGIEIVIASGRHHLSIASFEKETKCEGWIISSAGAMVRHAVTGEILHELTLPVELALEVYERGRAENCSLIGYHRTGAFIEEETEWIRVDTGRSRQPPRLADLRELARDGLQKLMLITAAEKIEALYPVLESEYRGRLYVVHTEREMIEFLSPEANKARGAQAVAARLGLAREQVIAFGDGNNDVPVLAWAGMSVAMDHGRPAARKAARLVTPAGPPEEAFARGVEMVLD